MDDGTGDPALAKPVVGALRGSGWNVANFIGELTKATSQIVGNDPAASVLRLGRDARPDV